MRSGPFIAALAQAYRADEATVKLFARFLKEAGLISSGARGVNAPHMTPLDAARMTVALLSTDSPARAVERVQRFGPMALDAGESTATAADNPCLAGEGVTLEAALARLLTYRITGPDGPEAENAVSIGAPYVEVLENAKKATIQFGGFAGPVAVFRDAVRSDDVKARDRAELFGIRRARGLAAHELLSVAVVLGEGRA